MILETVHFRLIFIASSWAKHDDGAEASYTVSMKLPAILRQERILGGAFVLALTQLGASVMGLLRDRILFQTFPAFNITDVYFASFRPSDFLFQTCIASALGTVLVPVLAGYRAHGNKEEMQRVLNGTMTLGAVVFGVIALILAVILPWIAPYLVQFQGDELALYVQFGRLALLSNFLFVFGSTLGQHLITIQRFWIYGLTPILYTLGTIGGTIFLTPIVGPSGPMVGTVLGALIYVLLRAIAVAVSGIHFRPTLWHPDFTEMGKLMLPRVLSLGAIQLQLLVFDAVGSGLGTGAVSINVAARNFQSVGVGVVGIALAQAVYSSLSQAAARKDTAMYITYLRKSLIYALCFTIFCAIALIFLTPIAAKLVTMERVYPIFRMSLILYALSIPLESLNHLLLRAYYALKDTLLPAMITVLGGIVAIVVAWYLSQSWGIYALAMGYAAGQAVQTGGLGLLLTPRLKRLKRETH